MGHPFPPRTDTTRRRVTTNCLCNYVSAEEHGYIYIMCACFFFVLFHFASAARFTAFFMCHRSPSCSKDTPHGHVERKHLEYFLQFHQSGFLSLSARPFAPPLPSAEGGVSILFTPKRPAVNLGPCSLPPPGRFSGWLFVALSRCHQRCRHRRLPPGDSSSWLQPAGPPSGPSGWSGRPGAH